jgi:zinc/manganese transport system substrate-binding protein
MRLLAGPILVVVAAALCACGTGLPRHGRFTVVATTTQAADLSRAVAGRYVTVVQLLDPNVDPHEYEPRPSDAKALARADLIVRSGADIDDWLGGVIKSSGTKARVVDLIDSVPTRRRGGSGDVDPHWWQNPRNGERAVAAIRSALAAADPANRAGFASDAARYAARLRRLDRAIAKCVSILPPSRRELVTSHDALGYFADRYGFVVLGSVIPALTSQAQPSAGETAKLVRRIRAAGVKAIFPEASLNPRLASAVARDSGARVGGKLYADTLGPKGSPGQTYIGSLAANARAIVSGLTGDPGACRLRVAA